MNSGPTLTSVKSWSVRNRQWLTESLLLVAILAATLSTRLDSYLLFHAFAELFSIVVAFAVFIIAWQSYPMATNNYLLVLGVGSAFIAVIDTIHTIGYQGMGLLTSYGATLSTQLWLAARSMQALTVLLAPLFLHRTLNRYWTLATYAATTGLLLACIFAWRIFPITFVEGTGLTPFKTYSEYGIIVVLLAALGLLWSKGAEFDPTVLALLVGSVVSMILSEMLFTHYLSLTSTSNVLGHLFKIVEFYLLYLAVVEIGFTRPYSLIFRQMKQDNDAQVAAQRQQAEKRTAELDAIFSSMSDGAVLYDQNGTVIRMNRAAEALFEYSGASPDQPMAQRAKLHGFMDEDGLPVDKLEDMPLGLALRGKTVHEMVLGLPKAQTGELAWLAFSATPIHDAAGETAGAVLTFRDITERKQAAEDMQRLNEELERRVISRTGQLQAANQELEAFAYSVSHDLRAPLRHIDGFIKLMERKITESLDGETRHYMDLITRSVKEMNKLIDDLLLFSRMGRVEMSETDIDLEGLVREVIREFDSETEGRNIEWSIGKLPCVNGDRAMLRIAITNLLSNALKFTRPRERARIEVGSLPNPAADYVIFVRDNGVGFDMQYADKLFGVFQRLHSSDEFEGTGIGLANVRRIIARHGGQTWAEAKVDGGATFSFSLPRSR